MYYLGWIRFPKNFRDCKLFPKCGCFHANDSLFMYEVNVLLIYCIHGKSPLEHGMLHSALICLHPALSPLSFLFLFRHSLSFSVSRHLFHSYRLNPPVFSLSSYIWVSFLQGCSQIKDRWLICEKWVLAESVGKNRPCLSQSTVLLWQEQ